MNSPVVEFVGALYRNARASYRWLNPALYRAVSLAIEAGMPFAEEDIVVIYRTMNGARWFAENGEERWYALAVDRGNTSACAAIERHLGRPRYRADGKILALGSAFRWDNREVQVTSFGVDHLVACAYEQIAPAEDCPACCNTVKHARDRVVRRYKLTVADICAAKGKG